MLVRLKIDPKQAEENRQRAETVREWLSSPEGQIALLSIAKKYEERELEFHMGRDVHAVAYHTTNLSLINSQIEKLSLTP